MSNIDDFSELLNYRKSTHCCFTITVFNSNEFLSQSLYLMPMDELLNRIQELMSEGLTVVVSNNNWNLRINNEKLDLGYGVMNSDSYEFHSSLSRLFAHRCEASKGYALSFNNSKKDYSTS